MIFQKALVQELRLLAGGIFAVLLTILVTTTLIRVLGRAAGGRIDIEFAMPLIALSTLNTLGIVLGLTAYIAVLMVMTRASKDSELVVWQAAGLGLGAWIKPVFLFIWPFILGVIAFTFVVAPWSQAQLDVFRAQFEQRSDEQRLSPGQFIESQSGRAVFFGEISQETGQALGVVFVRLIEQGVETLVMASSGQLEQDNQGQSWLRLKEGTRTDLWTEDLQMRSISFESYAVSTDQSPTPPQVSRSLRASQLLELIAQGKDGSLPALAEISARLSLVFLSLLLPFLAIPMASMNPRMGRYFHILLGIIVFMLASNLMTLSQAWIAQGRVSFGLGWWPIPAAFLLLTFLLFRVRGYLIRGPVEFLFAQTRALRRIR